MTGFSDILVEVSPGETRAALVAKGGTLVEFFIERAGMKNRVGGLYLARIRKIEKRLRGAFVDIAPGVPALMDRLAGEHEGQVVMVQIVRDASAGKHALARAGAVLSSRHMTLVADGDGIAWTGRPPGRKEAIEESIATLAGGWRLGPGIAELDEKETLRRGAALWQLWEQLQEQARSLEAPAVLSPPPDLIRHLLLYRAKAASKSGSRFGRIITDDRRTHARIEAMIETEMPELRGQASLEAAPGDLFEEAGVEEQVAAALDPVAEIPGGGELVIESTEALTAIDVNLAAAGGRQSSEQAVLSTNLAAAEEVARQVILRNISGLIVVDFVSMRNKANRRRLVETQRRAFRDSTAQTDVLGITAGGLVEITRRRERASLMEIMYGSHTRPVLAPLPESTACQALREILRDGGGPGRRVIRTPASVIAALQGPLGEAFAETERRLGETPELREAPELATFEIVTELR